MNKHLQWLITNSRYLKIYPIEKELAMPEGTLYKFTEGKRGLPEVWHKPVIKWVRRFRK